MAEELIDSCSRHEFVDPVLAICFPHYGNLNLTPISPKEYGSVAQSRLGSGHTVLRSRDLSVWVRGVQSAFLVTGVLKHDSARPVAPQ